MRARRRLTAPLPPLTLVVLLAGCASPGGVDTLPIDVPAPRDLLPAAVEGYSLGHESAIDPRDQGMPGLLDGHNRVFDGQVNGTGMRLVTSAMRFQDVEDASAAMETVHDDVGAQPNATRPDIGDDAVQLLRPFGEGSSILVVRKGPVLWMLHHSFHGPADHTPDLAVIARPLVERVST